MDEEKTGFWIIMCLVFALFFVIGMQAEKYLLQQKYTNLLNNYINKVNDNIQQFNFTLIAYSRETNQTLPEPFAAIIASSDESEKIYYNLFVPAIEGKAVCFVNTYNETKAQNTTRGGTNEFVQ